ncbi:MAG TPA: hypothetical protein DCZ10_06900 [Pelotomaculum sp.]|nr:hypothetical protein [Pelotomaculum sp.]
MGVSNENINWNGEVRCAFRPVEGCHSYSQPEARSQTVDEVMPYVKQKTNLEQELKINCGKLPRRKFA